MPFISKLGFILICTALYSFNLCAEGGIEQDDVQWTKKEFALINSLRLAKLPNNKPSLSNKFADNLNAIELGRKIFHDSRFSQNNNISCSTCHKADYNFTDNLALAKGLKKTTRRSMPIVGMEHQTWFFWDGRKDSLWSQALGPLENEREHGISRTEVLKLIRQYYKDDYIAIFGELPAVKPQYVQQIAYPSSDNTLANTTWQTIPTAQQQDITQAFVNIGKSIAAFVRTIKPQNTRFDVFADSLKEEKLNNTILTKQEQLGLKLFIGKANCINCHNGPLFSNGEFHHAGVIDNKEIDHGRGAVIDTILDEEFNCYSQWSDANAATECPHLDYLAIDQVKYQQTFKTPSLRNVAIRSPYMHAGQFNSLQEVLRNYRDNDGSLLSDELQHSNLNDNELDQLEAFLQTLTELN
ncbi:cytochrome c peroxidase [Thalassotalea psychrophila]|uniref:Cytochrome c peroxidase n=1 Tax=Thalassotalea psychrophila TaxID=3065647 RepID=A0ABY9TXV9_9GAMM|nr:cytochrome c peroxidase [Colwelliaceae bacterium SQ149]